MGELANPAQELLLTDAEGRGSLGILLTVGAKLTLLPASTQAIPSAVPSSSTDCLSPPSGAFSHLLHWALPWSSITIVAGSKVILMRDACLSL